jgi:hypothetical protein
MKYIFISIIIFLLSGCQSIDPIPKKNSNKKEAKAKEPGAYSLGKGLEENLPESLDEIPNAKPKYEALSKWTLIYESSDSGSKYYANILEIKPNKKFSKLRLWTIEDFNLLQEVASYKYLSVKSFTEFDCKYSKIRIMGYSLYEKNMAKGDIVFSKGTPFEWQKINKNTINEKYLDIACKESGLS